MSSKGFIGFMAYFSGCVALISFCATIWYGARGILGLTALWAVLTITNAMRVHFYVIILKKGVCKR